MKPILAFVIICVFAINSSKAQTLSDTITIVNESSLTFRQHDSLVLAINLSKICASNKEASDLIRSAHAQQGLSTVAGAIGGFCLGYGAVGLLFKNKTAVPILIVGAPFLVTGLLVESSSKRKIIKAVKAFNASLKE